MSRVLDDFTVARVEALHLSAQKGPPSEATMITHGMKNSVYLKMSFGLLGARARAAVREEIVSMAPRAGGAARAPVAAPGGARATRSPASVGLGRRKIHSAASGNWFAVVETMAADARLPATASFSAAARSSTNWWAAASDAGSAAALPVTRRLAMDTGAENWYAAAERATKACEATPVAFDRNSWNWFRAASRA